MILTSGEIPVPSKSGGPQSERNLSFYHNVCSSKCILNFEISTSSDSPTNIMNLVQQQQQKATDLAEWVNALQFAMVF